MDKALHLRIRELRKQRGMTLREVATPPALKLVGKP
jgi:hypothetical protein